ncbi:MAG: hypothetical protein IT430_07115 [Phycisphaerales bacterium]|nr:hypothetical protein [Phycisphaerales bacterium]
MSSDVPRSDGAAEPDPVEVIGREDREAYALHEQAAARQSAAVGAPSIGFGRQMLQLVLIPALIVGGVLAVWLVVVSLGGKAQSLGNVLETLSKTGGGAPADQERARTALSLLSIIEEASDPAGPGLSQEDEHRLASELPKIARLNRGGHEELSRAIMGTLGLLGDPSTVEVFREFLQSDDPDDWFAAVSGLHGWRGDMAALRPLAPELLQVLRNAPRPTENPRDDRPIDSLVPITMSVLAVAADPGDIAVREALAKELGAASGASRDIAWNAGTALAVMGDQRGIPVVMSLLDRQWLSQQPYDARVPEGRLIDPASQRKIITSTINVVVGFDPRLKGFAVRVESPAVWDLIAKLAADDPDSAVRAAAKAALDAREAQQQSAASGESDG